MGKNLISNARAIVQAGLIPYYDEDPDTDDYSVENDVGPFLKADVIFKNSDKNVDLKVETSQGVKEYNDYPLSLEWSNRLRNLKLSGTIASLIRSKIVYPCVATLGSVRTNDNVTYAYEAGSCYTLMSANCGPTPAFAVFAKKEANGKMGVKAYFGGHLVEIDDNTLKINGAPKNLRDGKEEVFENEGVEIFKYVKWGSTIHVYSFKFCLLLPLEGSIVVCVVISTGISMMNGQA